MINIYCDESCHLENDGINVMGLGGICCDKQKIVEINERIREIKTRNNTPISAEIKWTKVSPCKLQLYTDIVNYFFDESSLSFRVLIVPDKGILDHERFHQTHDDWYYKMYFEMLKAIFNPDQQYNVYVDIKDSHSALRVRKLQEVCRNNAYDFSHKIIQKIQPIRSDEVQIMQMIDILLGAVTYANRVFPDDFQKSRAKLELIDLIRKRSGYSLARTTLLRESKFNILIWEGR